MSSFLGKFYYTLDLKGRIIIPVPLREIIFKKYNNLKLYITIAPFDNCVQIYPFEEWNRFEEKLRAIPDTEDAKQYILKRVIAAVTENSIDNQGRILIPYELRQDANISGDIVIVGQVNKIEIWNKADWFNITDPAKIDIKAFKSTLSSYGF